MKSLMLVCFITLLSCEIKKSNVSNEQFYIRDFEDVFAHNLWKENSIQSLSKKVSARQYGDDKEKYIYETISSGVSNIISQSDKDHYPNILKKLVSEEDMKKSVDKVYIFSYSTTGEIYSESINFIFVSEEACFSYLYSLDGADEIFHSRLECELNDIKHMIGNYEQGNDEIDDSYLVITELTKSDLNSQVIISPTNDIIEKLGLN